MSEAYRRATECVERLPCLGTLERAMVILARAGVGLPQIRSWAVRVSELHGIWPYVARDLPRLLGIAVAEAIETRRLELQQHRGA
jgi:hypothetical protein